MKKYKVISGDKLEGSVIAEGTLLDLITNGYFPNGTQIQLSSRRSRFFTYNVVDGTLRTQHGNIVLPRTIKNKTETRWFLPHKKYLVYHPMEMPVFAEIFPFKDADKWLKRACGRIVFHVKGSRGHVFEPAHFAYHGGKVWAWNDVVGKCFDRFDKDREDATYGMNASPGEKARHNRLYREQKERAQK